MPELPVLVQRPRPRHELVESDRADIARELAGAIEGEVRFGLHDRMLYATDASLYQVEPLGVVVPANVEDAVTAVKFCASHGLPILPRGGGTSLAGQCTNRAVVIDFSARCRAIRSVDGAARTCDVEPGITVDDLNDGLTRMGGEAGGLFFAPDPATSRQANIGGCIGNNAAGARSIRYGRTSESVLAVEACLADGNRVELGRGAALRDKRVSDLTRRVSDVVWEHAALIRERFPKTVRRNAGYGLDMILNQLEEPGGGGATVNLAHLLCGSEGTLAVTLGAVLKLHPKPVARGLVVVGFASVDESIAAVVPILATNPSAVELLDDTVIDLARANTEYRRYVELMPRPSGALLKAVLYVEYFGGSADEVRANFEALRRVVGGAPMQAHTDAGAIANAWKLRKAGEPLLHGVPGNRKPLTFVEDNAVPVERLAEFVREFRRIVSQHGTRAAFYAHASVGVLHVRPLLDLHSEEDRQRLRSIAVQVADLARSLGGVMSGEHGDGRVRTPLLERFYGPELMAAFREVKRIFDPGNLLNPGNIVDLTGEEPRPVESMTDRLRVDNGEMGARGAAGPSSLDRWHEVDTFFDYSDQDGFDAAVEMCNGAGVCRKKQGGTMCPSYMGTLDERHSTRGRGNALRLAITGQFGAARWNDAETMRTLDLCLSCKACKTECPSNVDIARLKAEYTAQHFRERGTPLAARLMGSIRTLNRLGSAMAPVANWLGGAAPARSVINVVMGFDARRSLPRFEKALAGTWSARARPAFTGPPSGGEGAGVVFFGDCFTMYNEPEIGLATKAVLEAFGYRPELIDAGCCGRAKISLGVLPQAIAEIDRTLDKLGPIAARGDVRAILVAEPSCLSAIKDDWLGLKLKTPREVRIAVAAKAMLPEQFLERFWNEHPKRPRFTESGAPVILHGHCHQKALWGVESSAALLRRFCGANLQVLDSGCCGMAGGFGFGKDRYDLSMRIGELALLPGVRGAAEEAIVVAPGTSCRHQIHDGAAKRALHPMELISSLLE